MLYSGVKIQHVTILDPMVIIRISPLKAGEKIKLEFDGVHGAIIRKYLNLRPVGVDNDSFLLKYKNGQCSSESAGLCEINKIPLRVAQFLDLDNPMRYNKSFTILRVRWYACVSFLKITNKSFFHIYLIQCYWHLFIENPQFYCVFTFIEIINLPYESDKKKEIVGIKGISDKYNVLYIYLK